MGSLAQIATINGYRHFFALMYVKSINFSPIQGKFGYLTLPALVGVLKPSILRIAARQIHLAQGSGTVRRIAGQFELLHLRQNQGKSPEVWSFSRKTGAFSKR
jgi:hypothetical protein